MSEDTFMIPLSPSYQRFKRSLEFTVLRRMLYWDLNEIAKDIVVTRIATLMLLAWMFLLKGSIIAFCFVSFQRQRRGMLFERRTAPGCNQGAGWLGYVGLAGRNARAGQVGKSVPAPANVSNEKQPPSCMEQCTPYDFLLVTL